MNTIIQTYPNRKQRILNLVLLGITGVALIQLANIAFYVFMPSEYFVRFLDDVEVTEVCKSANGKYALQTTIKREIYPYLPENVRMQRSVPASARVDVIRNFREIDSIEVPYITYQWKLNKKVDVQNELNIVLLPGHYETITYVYLDLPYSNDRNPIILSSNTFNVPGELKACE